MNTRRTVAALLMAGLAAGTFANAEKGSGACAPSAEVERTTTYRVNITNNTVQQLHPHFFGFNLEWIGFQEDLWDNEAQKVRPDIIGALQAFPGAVYRYPGGTEANYFDWRASVGHQELRPMRRAVDWRGPLATHFGFHEYLDFVAAVGGQSWLVANLYGHYEGELDSASLASQAGQWANVARKAGAKVVRWELGNELDRDRYRWSPAKYSARAMDVAQAIRASEPFARFVGLLQDYDAQPSISAMAYNTQTSSALATLTPDHALHLYYDGPPGGPPVPHRLRHLCASAAAAKAGGGRPASIWVTEHARWPAGRVTDPDWKKNWGKTSNLEGALSVADMVIALSQTPGVEGAFLHSLAGTFGPWPLFHRTREGLKPSAVYWALRVLREDMLDQILVTQTGSRNGSGYAGGYDIRASLLTNVERSKFVLWAVNRFGEDARVRLTMPMLAGKSVDARYSSLADANPHANNVLDGRRLLPNKRSVSLTFDAQGVALVFLPAYSVSAISINK